MKTFFFSLLGLVMMQYISSDDSCPCSCEEDTPLKFVFKIASHFKEVQGCGRSFVTNISVSKDGVRRISYQAELKVNESPIELCDCIHVYLSQKDWLDGSIKSCCVRKNIATMTIEGEPDPTYNEETENSDSGDAIEQLKGTFDQFDYAEIENHHCRPSTRTDESGKIHFELQCDLRPDSPCKEEFCERVLWYLNQDNWLGELTSKCESDGKVLDMEIMAK